MIQFVEKEELDPLCVYLQIRIDWPEDGPEILSVYPTNVCWFEGEIDIGGTYGAIEDLLRCHTEWAKWMLERGISPGQGFVVRVLRPVYRYVSDEVDASYQNCDVIAKDPVSGTAAATAWTGWLLYPGYGKLLIPNPSASSSILGCDWGTSEKDSTVFSKIDATRPSQPEIQHIHLRTGTGERLRDALTSKNEFAVDYASIERRIEDNLTSEERRALGLEDK